MVRVKVQGTTPARAEVIKLYRHLGRESGPGVWWWFRVDVCTAPHIAPVVRRSYTVLANDDRMAAQEAFDRFSRELDYADF
jgi:hypothetical protein